MVTACGGDGPRGVDAGWVMSEPSTTAAGVAGGIMLAGVATGLQADLVFPAFVGAIWSLKALEPGGGVVWRVVQVVVGTLIGAWATPVAAQAVTGMLPAALAGMEALRYPLAWAIGWGGLRLGLPVLERRVGRGAR